MTDLFWLLLLHGIDIALDGRAFAGWKGEDIADRIGKQLLGQANIRGGLNLQNKLAAILVLRAADSRDNHLAASRTKPLREQLLQTP